MKTLLSCATLMFLAVGCAVDPTPPATQDPATATSIEQSQLSGGPTPTAVNCDHPPTCAAFCGCDKQECLAEGNPLQLCAEEYTECFHQFCLHECTGFGCGN